MKNGTLVLNVIHGKEVEIEYKKSEILDKINCFFGYNCIDSIKLKIVQDKIKVNNKIFPKIQNLSKIKDKMSKVNNDHLKNSLKNF